MDATDEDGRFSIRGLPLGTYTIEAWHERLGAQTATVETGWPTCTPKTWGM